MSSNGNWISKVIFAAWIVLGTAPAVPAQQLFVAPAPDEARDLFNVAMKFYDEDKLEEAEKRFREVVQKFPKNIIADRAEYYLIRTLNERGKRNDALTRINAFPRIYPKSKWSIDVEELRIRLTNQVSARAIATIVVPSRSPFPSAPPAPPSPPRPVVPVGAPFEPGQVIVVREQQEAVREQQQAVREQQQAVREQQQAIRELQQAEREGRSQSADPQVALQQEIMRAVFQNNPDRAIEIATERLKSNPADPLILSSLYLVAQSRSVQALPMLLTIAKSATNAKARKDAIFWISQSRADREMLVDTLVGLLPSLSEEEAESVAFSLGQVRNEKAINALATIARDKSKSQKIRDNALFWIGESRVSNRVSLLEDIYKSNMDSSKTRIQIMFALGQTRDPQAVSILANVASTDPDIEVRKQAVFWLGQNRSPEARQALENLLQGK